MYRFIFLSLTLRKFFILKSIFKLALNYIPRPLLIKLSIWIRPLLAWFYKGNNFTDPIDGRSFRKFLPYGYQNQRENVLSPSTLSLERHRLLWLWLKNETDFFSNNYKVLHFAPEQSFYSRFKKMNNLDYVTTDLNSPLADVHADICALPFENETFDIILCNHVLEHINDHKQAIKELYRVLKKGGFGILQVPLDINRECTYEDNSITNPEERAKLFGQYDHVRVYGMDFFELLSGFGFRVEAISYAKSLEDKQIHRYALNYEELLPVVYKE